MEGSQQKFFKSQPEVHFLKSGGADFLSVQILARAGIRIWLFCTRKYQKKKKNLNHKLGKKKATTILPEVF